jgi:3-oxoacyl-(acyl-carrier-protein) synthase
VRYWVQPTSERAASAQELSVAIATAIRPLLNTAIDGDARGIYLATGDAGVSVSVAFWAAALVETPRFASPAEFPWTLANAPASLLARELALRGPNYTLVGEADAMLAALEHAIDDLSRAIIDEAVLIGCNCEVSPSKPQAVAIVLRTPLAELPQRAPSGTSATDFLAGLCPGE